MNLRRSLIAFGSLALAVGLPVADLSLDGPYVTHFNKSLAARAAEAQLVGKPESEIVAVLGKPDRIDSDPRAYAYYPYPFLPVSQVKVFCEAGVTTGIKQFDD